MTTRLEGELADGVVLVTGASVAGCAAAWWLRQHGIAVEVVERAAVFREGGQNVDLRGIGRDVIRRMGLEEAALGLGTGEEGTRFVDGRGRTVASFAAGDGGGDGPTAEMEILRGDLAGLLRDRAVEAGAVFRFGDSVASVHSDDTGATVRFAGGREARYALVVVAEGVGSATRELVFPGENRPRFMGLTIAFFTVPRTADDDRMWRWFHAGKGRGVSLRPDPHGTIRAMLGVHKRPEGEHRWEASRQKEWVRARFGDAGWETPRVLRALDGTDDFYFDVLRQARMPRWSRGRVVLLGDAAWCVTPVGGRGTTLAVAGACVLAGELARTGLAGSVGSALSAYEGVMRPYVAKAQAVPRWVPRVFNPKTQMGVQMLRGGLWAANRPMVRRTLARFGSRETEAALPTY